MTDAQAAKACKIYVPANRPPLRALSVLPWFSHVRRYGACAGAEMSTLGISPAERKGGVPTIAVFRAADGVLLTMDGAHDVGQAGAGAVDLWEAAAAN